MTRSTKTSVAVPLLLALLAGCATAGRDTAIGAGVGGAAGAGVGALVGGKKGALIGLGVGALAGGSVGLYLDKQRKELEKVAEVKKTEHGLLVQMKNDILFDTGSDGIKAEGVTELAQDGRHPREVLRRPGAGRGAHGRGRRREAQPGPLGAARAAP